MNNKGRWRCDCPPGTQGSRCTAPSVENCASKPCANGGRCTELSNDYTCECTPQFTGKQCTTDVDECAADVLNSCIFGRETCVNTVGSYECECVAGLLGDACDVIPQDCSTHLCLNGGRCIDVQNSYECACAFGFYGHDCQHRIDNACAMNPCQNEGTCQENGDGFSCVCKTGYTGSFCDQDVNECDAADACSTTAEPLCFNSVGSFACCGIGYAGADCRDVDECSDPQSCHGRGVCTNNDGGYTCDCDVGFDPHLFCAPACPNEPTGAPPTAAPTTAPTTRRTRGPSAGPSTAGPDAAPTAEARGSASDANSGGFDILDYWYYIVSVLGVLIAVIFFVLYRKRSATEQSDYNDETYGGDSAYNKSKGSSGGDSAYNKSKGSSASNDSAQSIDSDGSAHRKRIVYSDLSSYDTESNAY